MAERRMFHAGVVESDSFLDMTPTAQALYFHLGMQADDDGFVNGPRQVCRRCGAQMEQLQELIDGGFLLWFDGVAVLKHFRMANTLQNDRLKQLRYPEIAKKLYLLPNRIYTTDKGKRKENLHVIRQQQFKMASQRVGALMESIRKPKVTKPNLTQNNPTQNNQTQPNTSEVKGKERIPDSADAEIPEQAAATKTSDDYMHRGLVFLEEERQGVVDLTNDEVYKILTTMGYHKGLFYIKKLAAFIKANDANIKDHYATILKWWEEDGGKTYD